MDKSKIEKIVYGLISIGLIIVIIWLSVGLIRGKNADAEEDATKVEASSDEGRKLYDNEEPEPVEEIVTVDTEVISDGLREMGVLVTEEYFFTQVENRTSQKKWGFFTSEASLAFSYDGTVSAGIDCNDIEIDKDDENKTITISIPKASILDVNIDHDSFKKLEESNGLWNKIDMDDYNDAIIDFKNAARKKATEKGVVEKADEGARRMIESFVNSLVKTDEYTIEYVTK